MGNKYPDKQRDVKDARDDCALDISHCNEWTLVKDVKPGRTFILKLLQSEICESWFQELFLKRSRSLGINIPKQLVFVPEHMSLGPKIAIDYPMANGIGDLGFRSDDVGTVGSVMGSNGMVNILNSPLFQRLGGTKVYENGRRVSSDNHGSPARLTSSPSHKSAFGNRGYQSDSVQRNLVPVSGPGLSSLMVKSSGSPSSQGMLQCTWDDGIPHFAFQLDDQKEVYVANLAKAEVIHEKELDYIYSFYFKASDQNLSDLSGIECDLIGKMKVSTSYTICSDSSKVIDTEFVLVGTSDNHTREIHQPSRNSRFSRKLSKVSEMFKAGPSLKPRALSKFGGTSAIPEDISENDFIPNLEVAAVVVKQHLKNEDEQEETGGWGLKFLKKSQVKPAVDDCSTSVDIIVPAGPHGGPRTKNGGPSSLIERWRSGGSCDCGGWDTGCPLKVLKAKPSSESQGDCKSFDMFTEGSDQTPAKLKMINIRDGLYFISFQSSFLSALQCFAIVVATIHSKTPSLSSKHVQS
ncbi:uncharacterized protein LOC141606863 isoform X2 [Silene latifolia]|uniref:uncharacterized protein LOC141606863 isoform X2 n=1 Tax=Silene latifolia TaxID=37657 RepID=UPI003D76A4E5